VKFLSTLLIQGYIANVRGKSKDEKVLQSVCDIFQTESASEVLVYGQSFVFLEKNLRHFSSTKEDFSKELFLDKRVTLPLKCRQGQLAKRNRCEFAKEMFLSYKQLFSSSLFEVRTTASGFGVFAKQTISIKQGELLAPQELSGTLEVCRDAQTQGIVIGLLSLANHSCSSPFSFARKKQSIPTRRGRSDSMFARASQSTTIAAGQEITICYAKKSELWFNCQCGQCDKAPAVAKRAQLEFALESSHSSSSEWQLSSSSAPSSPSDLPNQQPKRRGRPPKPRSRLTIN
jgi:hypothetical protein